MSRGGVKGTFGFVKGSGVDDVVALPWGFGGSLGGAGSETNLATKTLQVAVPKTALVVVGVTSDGTGGTLAGWTVNDSRGNVYTLTAPWIQGSSVQTAILYATIDTALQVGDAFRVSCPQSRQQMAFVAAYVTGAAATSRLDKTGTAGAGSATALTVSSATPTDTADEAVFAVFGFNPTARTLAVTPPHTAVDTVASSASTAARAATLSYRIRTTVGTASASGTLSPNASPHSASLASFRKAA